MAEPTLPNPVDTGDLPDAPTPGDESTFQAWKEALTTRSFERGKQHGLERGELRGLAEALLTILQARGMVVDTSARARIETCTDPALLKNWIGKVNTTDNLDALFSPELAPPPDKGS